MNIISFGDFALLQVKISVKVNKLSYIFCKQCEIINLNLNLMASKIIVTVNKMQVQ